MKKIWVFAEYANCTLDRVTLELLTKARELAKSFKGETQVSAVLLGSNIRNVCKTLCDYGAKKVYVAESDKLGLYNPILYSKIITKLAKEKKPDIFLFGATSIGSELGPTVAADLKTGMAAHCVDMKPTAHFHLFSYLHNEQLVSDVPSFGGKIIGEIICPDFLPQMASVKPGIFMQKELEKLSDPEIVSIDLSGINFDDVPLKAIGIEKREAKCVPVDKAEIVFCGGYGIGNRENWEKLERLASLFGGAVACTRPVVDEGWGYEEQMIGTSGKSIRPKAYVGFGISGATHHICGMKDSGLIISVNKDKKSPMFEVSDVEIVEDLNDVLEELITKLS